MYAATDEAIMQYVPDYKVNLIAPGQMTEEEIREFKTSLKEIMLYIKYSKDKIKLQEVIQADKGFRNLDRQAAEVINVTTNSRLKYPEGKEKIDMCVAIDEMVADGKIEGAVETYKEVGFSLQETIQRIADNYNISLQESEEKVMRYWK